MKRLLDWAIRKSLERAGVIHAMDYELLLRVSAGYCISEVEVTDECVLANKSLRESRPADRGIIVLGISHEGQPFLGAPGPAEKILIGDVITVYGREADIMPITK